MIRVSKAAAGIPAGAGASCSSHSRIADAERDEGVGRALRRGATAVRVAHPVGVRRPADDEEGHVAGDRSRGLGHLHDIDRHVRSEALGHGGRDGSRVAVHRFDHDERAHPGSPPVRAAARLLPGRRPVTRRPGRPGCGTNPPVADTVPSGRDQEPGPPVRRAGGGGRPRRRRRDARRGRPRAGPRRPERRGRLPRRRRGRGDRGRHERRRPHRRPCRRRLRLLLHRPAAHAGRRGPRRVAEPPPAPLRGRDRRTARRAAAATGRPRGRPGARGAGARRGGPGARHAGHDEGRPSGDRGDAGPRGRARADLDRPRRRRRDRARGRRQRRRARAAARRHVRGPSSGARRGAGDVGPGPVADRPGDAPARGAPLPGPRRRGRPGARLDLGDPAGRRRTARRCRHPPARSHGRPGRPGARSRRARRGGAARRDRPPERRAEVGPARIGVARPADAARLDPGLRRDAHGRRGAADAGGGSRERGCDRPRGPAAQPDRDQPARPGPDRGRCPAGLVRGARPRGRRRERARPRRAAHRAAAGRGGDPGGDHRPGRPGAPRGGPRQPPRERGSPHAGRDRPSASRPRPRPRPPAASGSRWRTPDRACPPRRCHGSSTRSTGCRPRAGRRGEGRGSGWRSCAGSWRRWAGPCGRDRARLGGLAIDLELRAVPLDRQTTTEPGAPGPERGVPAAPPQGGGR